MTSNPFQHALISSGNVDSVKTLALCFTVANNIEEACACMRMSCALRGHEVYRLDSLGLDFTSLQEAAHEFLTSHPEL